MAIIIRKIVKSINNNKLLVEAQHGDELLTVYLSSQNWEHHYLNTELLFEMDYEEVLDWKVIDINSDFESGLFSDESHNILIRGEVHNILEVENDTIIDIYICNGAEFMAITSSEIDNYFPVVGTGIELRIKGLCIYPVYN